MGDKKYKYVTWLRVLTLIDAKAAIDLPIIAFVLSTQTNTLVIWKMGIRGE